MEKDDFDWDDYIHTAGMGPRLLPVQATELLGGIGSRIPRSLLVAAPDDIREAYACSPEEAAVALACCELAELSVWDEAALIEAATVGGSEEQRLMWGCESRDRLARRISLSMKAEKAPEVMSPADGVLLLHRAGIHVFHQLLDAVAVMTIRPYTPESQSLYRQLKGIAEPQQTAPATDNAPPAPVEDVGASGEPTVPLPLTTSDIAFCFDGLRWDERGWMKPLGEKRKWLAACIAIPGQQGVRATRWNPVLIGAELVRSQRAKQNSVRARFQTKPLLMPWLDEWKTYEAANFDT